MTAGIRATVTIDKVAAGGDGMGRLADGRVVFVDGALPGEVVEVRLTVDKRDFAKADLVEVVTPSPARIEPPCPALARGCGGCRWQHADPGAQLRMKAEVVADALRRTARLPGAVVTLGAAVPAFAYRTTMRCAVTPGGLGLRSGASHRVVPLDGCLVAHPLLDDLLGHVAVTGADEITLRVSSATGERNALAHARGRDQPRFGRVPGDVGIGQRATITERVDGADLVVSAGSFFQSGPAAANVLVDAVRRASGTLADGPVVDTYGGVGLFGVCVSRGPVIVVESSRSACADARRNLRGRPDATVVCSTVEDWTPTPAPLVIADPARAGLGRAGVGVVAAAASRRVVLVSCDPVAMARDAALLAESGFEHCCAEVLDLFPNTPHVEVVTVFERR